MHETTLFCLPHAGGSAYFYVPLKKYLPDGFSLIPLELPGRGRRVKEGFCTDFEQLASDVVRNIRAHLAQKDIRRYALFGHSMGALLSYRCAWELTERPPFRVFLSSPPALDGQGSLLHSHCRSLPHAELMAKLQKLGGLSAEVLASPALLEYAEPIIRADFTALETWTPARLPSLPIPFTILSGSEESSSKMCTWATKSTEACAFHTFSGGHFYLSQHWQEISEIIDKGYSAHAVFSATAGTTGR